MAADPHVLDELRRLRARVPQLTGALAMGVDGDVLAQDTPGVDPQDMAALSATAHAAAVRLADATGQGEVRELLVHGVYGYVATFAAGTAAATAVLTLLAQERVNVGRLLLEGRRAAARIAEVLDEHAPAAQRARQTKPAKPPAKTAAVRTRTPRAPRTTTTNARTTTES
ncbi:MULTISPECIES: roadblock/LC7 domain-containing protein [Streptomyces]|uniref:roadblock/LC7 domain-containing protein n=1 Tax=Streptomyces TaxID=1883 RepID=UPI00201CFE36|nr:roadblock/LC7 domain-containing protein [Streptomyces panaciradicis]MCL6673131.1 roadblock/LC7 domain-containing protein [Streptomyces panaciradicis]